jgi:sugar lactone lactonase YvrE
LDADWRICHPVAGDTSAWMLWGVWGGIRAPDRVARVAGGCERPVFPPAGPCIAGSEVKRMPCASSDSAGPPADDASPFAGGVVAFGHQFFIRSVDPDADGS